MTAEELVRDLGTVAHSGSRAFLEQLAQERAEGRAPHRAVRRRVLQRVPGGRPGRGRLARRRAPGSTAHRWVSEGKDTFTSSPPSGPTRGTAVTLHLREDQKEFLDELAPARARQALLGLREPPHPAGGRQGDAAPTRRRSTRQSTARAPSGSDPRARSPRSSTTSSSATWRTRGGGESRSRARTSRSRGRRSSRGSSTSRASKPFELRLGMKHRGVRLYVKRDPRSWKTATSSSRSGCASSSASSTRTICRSTSRARFCRSRRRSGRSRSRS